MLRSTVKFLLFTVFVIVPIILQGQVVANFTASDTAGCAPMVIHFTNTSTGATSYSWNLGNGTLSSITDVSGAYLTAGTYTITLVASNGTTTNTRTMTVRVYGLPTVNFYASDTTVCPGTPVTFTSTTVPNSWGPVTYNWNFGDGLTSSAVSPAHSYPSAGNYNVTLFATNGKGCINSRSRNPYVRVSALPSVGFSTASTYYCNTPAMVPFTNTTIGVGPFTNFWRFGDGGTSTLMNPSRNYTIPGVYTITLRVTDGNGCKDSVVFPSYLTIGNLVADFTSVPNGCLNMPITFTNTSTTHLSSLWDFGDGGSSVIESPDHAYAATGTYTVKLIIFDGVCYDTITHPVTIIHPTGSFAITPARPCPPPALRTYTAAVPPGSTVTWSSLVYGPLGTGNTISHTVPFRSIMGNPVGVIDSITMIITNSIGCRDTVGRLDTVNSLLAVAGTNPAEGCAPLLVNFGVSVFSYVYNPFTGPPWYAFGYPGPDFGAIAYMYPYATSSYSWNFGDGTPLSSLPAPVHTYTTVGGVYSVICNIVTSNGCSASTDPTTVKVGARPPTPSFTRHPSRVCAGVPVHFSGTATGIFNKYNWNYMDGSNPDTVLAPTHVFTTPGIYDVEFTTVHNGCPSYPYVLRDTIDSPNAVINYNFDCIPSNQISFRNFSLGADTHLWQFGDGTTSTLDNPVHLYPSLSTYVTTLTTHNTATGCRDTAYSIIKLQRLTGLMGAYRPNVCRDHPDTIHVEVFGVPGDDTTYAAKYRWYADGVMWDSVVTSYEFDTVYRSFNTTGVRQVRLILTDNHGCFDTLSMNILVAKPVDSFSFTPPSGCGPLTVNFTDHSTDVPGATITNYYWLFGDGYGGSYTTPTATHVYSANGTYNVREIVVDNFGCRDTLISSSHPVVRKPTAAFTAAFTSICAKRSLHFNNTTTGTFTSLWLFGDGDTSTVTAPNHIYSVAGTYTVKLVVTDGFGCQDTLTRSNYITVKPLPVPSFYMDDSFAICSPMHVHFHNTSTGASSYFWTFGDGTSSSSVSPSDVYITPAYYRVKLLAINSFSCTDTAIAHVNLFGYAGGFSYTPHSGCNPLPVSFSAAVPPIAASVVWDFSDGVTSVPASLYSATHVYSTTGLYVPKLILTDSFGCTNFSIGTDTIKVGVITPGFTYTPDPVCQGNLITFNDTSTSYFSPVSSWLWSFAPGATSTLRSPTYSYSLAGAHTVTLAVTDTGGCVGTVTRSVTVNSLPPAISGSSTVCMGTSTTLSNATSGGVWSSGTPGVAMVGSVSGVVTGVALGTAVITYSVGLGCNTIKTITVTPAATPITGPPGVCIGSTITLANATGGGVWSSGSPGTATVGSASGVVAGVASGAAVVTYSVTGCSVTRAVTVFSLPSAITGNTGICVGMTTPLTVTPAGGTWSSGSPGVAGVGSASGIVLGIGGGTAGITYLLSTGCRATTTVTVNPPLSPISGSPFVCISGSTTFTNSMGGGLWTSGNGTIATVGSSSGVVTGAAAGVTSISYSAGGCVAVKTVSVNTSAGSVTGVNEVCLGSSATLTGVPGGGSWSSASPTLASVGSVSGVVLGVSTGTANISYSPGGGCLVVKNITVNPLPSAISGTSNLCVGVSATLINSTTGGSWSSASPGVAGIGSATGILTGAGSGVAIISYTIANGCAATYPVTVTAVPPVTGLANMCAYSDTIFVHNANPAGLFGSSSVTIYNLGGGSGMMIANGPGVATITYTLTSGCSLFNTITINPLPGAITGTRHVCAGATTTLADTSAGGVWSSSNNAIGSVGSASGIVAGISGGIVMIKYTIPTGCEVEARVTVNPVPIAGSISGSGNVCPGQTITLTASVPGGVWSSSNPTATVTGGVVSGVTAGVDTIMYFVSNSCGTATSTHVVTINPLPIAGAITGPSVLCVGGNITLANAVTGGIWAGANISATVAAGVVTGVSPGPDTISYTVTNTCGTAVTTHPVTVNPLPDAGTLTGPSSVCVGDSILLSGSVTTGTLSGSTGNALVTSWRVKGVYAGLDTIVYTVTNSCGSAQVAKPVVIDPLPYAGIISGEPDLCVGDSIVLSDSVSGGSWSSSSSLFSLSGSVVVKGIAEGADVITYSITNNCGTAIATRSITVNPLPGGLTITKSEFGLSVGQGYATYQWTLNGVPIPGATSATYTFTAIGDYSVIVTNSFGCSYTYAPITITDCSIEDLHIFPNPAEDIIYVKWCKKVSLRLSCMDGKIVSELSNATEMDISLLPNGVYSLTLFDATGNKILTRRITKIR